MARDGSGNYNLPLSDVVADTTILASWANTTLADIAVALTASLAKDGQTNPTSNLPMNGFRHTGVSASSALTDYARVKEVVDGAMHTLTSVGGTANVITATGPYSMSTYAAGMKFSFVATAANTSSATININSIGAKTIKKGGGSSNLIAGDIPNGAVIELQYDGTFFQLLAPAASLGDFAVRAKDKPTVQVYTSTGASTWTKPADLDYIVVELVGGGGAGGGSVNTTSTTASGGAGGGGGGYSRKVIDASLLGSTEDVWVGAGGTGISASTGNNGNTSYFGDVGSPFLQATGGVAGAFSPAQNIFSVINGGQGGVGTLGDINCQGGPGQPSIQWHMTGNASAGTAHTHTLGDPYASGGAGGNSMLGGGAPGVQAQTTPNAGQDGGAYGGGGGGSANGGGDPPQAGGDGADGIVIIYEYFEL